jgi:hypothetical protein
VISTQASRADPYSRRAVGAPCRLRRRWPSIADICTEATAALDAFNAAIANVKADDTATWEVEAKELSGKLGEIAGKTDDVDDALAGVDLRLAFSPVWPCSFIR